MKNAVRTFLADAAAFEAEAVTRFRASAELQAVFTTEAEFLRFRRARRRANAIWRSSPTFGRNSITLNNSWKPHCIRVSRHPNRPEFAPIRASTSAHDRMSMPA